MTIWTRSWPSLAAMILVSLIIPKMGPFLSLVVAAILFGLLAGMGQELMGYMATGLGRIFSSLAIVVFSGALLAEYLRRTGAIERIIADLGGLAHQSLLVSGAAGYLVSLPVMCSITAYMILEPVVSGLGKADGEGSKRALFMTAVCSVISFNLIYPSPVMVSLSSSFGVKPYDLLMTQHSHLTGSVRPGLHHFAHCPARKRTEGSSHTQDQPSPSLGPSASAHGAHTAGRPAERGEHPGRPRYCSAPGALLCLALAREMMQDLIHVASRRSGVILLDLCGAGAFGYVVAQSNLGEEIYRLGQFSARSGLAIPDIRRSAARPGVQGGDGSSSRPDPGRLSAGRDLGPAHCGRSLHVLLYLRSILLADQKLHRSEHERDGYGIHSAPQHPGPGGLRNGCNIRVDIISKIINRREAKVKP